MRQFILAGFVVVLIGAAVTAASAGVTAILTYTPTHSGVTANVSGSCWTSSIAAQRPDAFRCTSGNEIFDPCFVTSSTVVVCPTDLIHNHATLMKLTEALPANTNRRSGEPWAFELQSGGMCQMGTGTISPGYPFYCSGPPVCGMPKLMDVAGAYMTRCGKPKTPLTVGSVRTEKVVCIWK
jgi:hypothetical protein